MEEIQNFWICLSPELQSDFYDILSYDSLNKESFEAKLRDFYYSANDCFLSENYLKQLRFVDTKFLIHLKTQEFLVKTGQVWDTTVTTTQKHITPILLVGVVATGGFIKNYTETDGFVDWQNEEQTDVHNGIKINSITQSSRYMTVDASNSFTSLDFEFTYKEAVSPQKVNVGRDIFKANKNGTILKIDLSKIADMASPGGSYTVQSVKIVRVNYN